MARQYCLGLTSLSFLLFSCSCIPRGFHPSSSVASSRGKCDSESFQRDWMSSPPFFLRSEFTGRLMVLGDVHGDFQDAVELLSRAGMARGTPQAPEWLGGKNILVLVGDVIDKGENSIQVLDFLMGLEAQATNAGGALVVLPGNHEIAFLADPFNAKAKEFRKELLDANQDVCRDAHSPRSRIGAWLRNRPIAAIVNGVFISHTGYSYEKNREEIEGHYREMVDEGRWNKKFACGDDSGQKRQQGFFDARVWWGRKGKVFFAQQETLGVRQVIFGHDPGAFKARGDVRGYFGDKEGSALIKLDVGMWQGDSRGKILSCDSWSANGACAGFSTLTNPPSPEEKDSGFRPLTIESDPPPTQSEEDPTDAC